MIVGDQGSGRWTVITAGVEWGWGGEWGVQSIGHVNGENEKGGRGVGDHSSEGYRLGDQVCGIEIWRSQQMRSVGWRSMRGTELVIIAMRGTELVIIAMRGTELLITAMRGTE